MDLRIIPTKYPTGDSNGRTALRALLIAGGYYYGALIGFALTFLPVPIAIVWPPNAVLLAGLLMSPVRSWWAILLAVLPVHFIIELQSGVPLTMILGWFASNCSEALLGAAGVGYVLRQRLRFDSFQHVSVFLLCCVLLAPFASSFLDVALVKLVGWGRGEFWSLWRTRMFSNMLATLLIVPVLLAWPAGLVRKVREAAWLRQLEAGILAIALVASCGALALSGEAPAGLLALLLFAPLPLLLWAAVRFEPFFASTALLLFATLAMAAAFGGSGPFAAGLVAGSTPPLQLFLIGCAVPLLLLSAAAHERRAGEASLRQLVHAERMRAEAMELEQATLRASEARWRQIVISMPQVVWAAGADGCIDYVNRTWLEQPGTPVWPAGEQARAAFMHPDDREQYLARWRAALADGQPFETEYRVRFPCIGEYRWYLARALPVRDTAGAVVRWIGTSTDIDAQKNAELAEQVLRAALAQRLAERSAELRRANDVLRGVLVRRRKAIKAERMSEARFSNVFRLSPDAMSISADAQGPVLDVNDRWQQLFGYQRAEVIGKTARDLNLYANEQADAAMADGVSGPDAIRDLEVDMRGRDGAILNTVVSGVRIDCGGASCFITIVRDVTAQRQRESEARQHREQLTYLTRVVLLGELSGALAHELNQPLAAILTNAQAARRFLRREPADLHEVGAILDDIVDDDKRAGEVIRSVRALFMKAEPVLQPLDINELVRDALALTHSTLIERKVAVVLKLGAGLGAVLGDRVQLQQVLLNLIVNACEAMNGTEAKARRLELLTSADGDRALQIAVTDTGPGIAAEAIGKVFDSFFTTKAYGLGFGLSITRAIIVDHGGRIEAVNSQEGGAVFRFTLPLAGDLS